MAAYLYRFMDRRGAKRGLKIVMGTVPLFCVAGFIESFMTRHTEWPDVIRLTIILLSAAFIIYYYVVLPYLRNKSQILNIKPQSTNSYANRNSEN